MVLPEDGENDGRGLPVSKLQIRVLETGWNTEELVIICMDCSQMVHRASRKS